MLALARSTSEKRTTTRQRLKIQVAISQIRVYVTSKAIQFKISLCKIGRCSPRSPSSRIGRTNRSRSPSIRFGRTHRSRSPSSNLSRTNVQDHPMRDYAEPIHLLLDLAMAVINQQFSHLQKKVSYLKNTLFVNNNVIKGLLIY